MIQDILLPFLAIGLAELGDKTQLTIFLLASKTKKHFELLLGSVLAFVLADGLAVIFGDIIGKIVPINYIKIGSGVLFILFGIFIIINKQKEESNFYLKNPFFSAFGLILVSEMGDKTQITAGLFAAKFNPYLVFIGVISALAILSIIAIYLGRLAITKINKKLVSKIAGILFIVIGIFLFFK